MTTSFHSASVARWRMDLYDQLPAKTRQRIAEVNASDYELLALVANLPPPRDPNARPVPQGLVRRRHR